MKASLKRTELDERFAIDQGIYAGLEHKLTDRLSMEYGVRWSFFNQIGPSTFFEYEDPQDNENINVLDTVNYNSWKNIRGFNNPEPRLMARYLINQQSSVKFSYNRMVQYIHLVSNSTVPVPFNTWTPSGPNISPQKSDQVALGYFYNLKDDSWELSAEVYYKEARDITEFADNASLFFNEHLSTEFRQGDAESYGLEIFARKKKGRFTGFLSYTLGEAKIEVPGINQDQVYPANYDRRHNLNLLAAYEYNERLTFGANFTFTSGRPITLPSGQYEFEDYQVNLYTERNGYRLPDYHRLDLSVVWTPKKRKEGNFNHSLSFGVYNIYNNQNPFTIYTRRARDEDDNIIGDGTTREARLVYLFGALPYFTWNFNF